MKAPPEPITDKQRDDLLRSAVVLIAAGRQHPIKHHRVDAAPPTKKDYRT